MRVCVCVCVCASVLFPVLFPVLFRFYICLVVARHSHRTKMVQGKRILPFLSDLTQQTIFSPINVDRRQETLAWNSI